MTLDSAELALAHSNIAIDQHGLVKDASLYLDVKGHIYKVNVKVRASSSAVGEGSQVYSKVYQKALCMFLPH
jgi:hypothetical protein